MNTGKFRAGALCLMLSACGGVDTGAPLPLSPDEFVTLSADSTKVFTTDDIVVTLDVKQPPDSAPVEVQTSWSVLGGTGLPEAAEGLTVPAAATTKGEVWTLTAQVSQEGESLGSVELGITVENSPPDIVLFDISPRPTQGGQPVTSEVVVEDADGDETTLTFEWSADDQVLDGQSGSVLPPYLIARGMTLKVKVIADDGDDTTTARASARVVNSAPSAPVAKITPEFPMAGTDDLLCVVDEASIDADGDDISYAGTWKRDGVAYLGFETNWRGDTLPASTVQAGDEWVCELVGIDAQGPGEPGIASVFVPPASPELVSILAGTFVAGSPDTEVGREGDFNALPEGQRTITLSNDLQVGRYEVTRAEYAILVDELPEFTEACDDCPITNISWHEAAAYTNALSASFGLEECYTCAGTTPESCTFTALLTQCEGYRLPTESEWEYIARSAGGSSDALVNGESLVEAMVGSCEFDTTSSSQALSDFAWYCGSADGPQAVGQLQPSALSLYDLMGNVSEWTNDDERNTSNATDPLFSGSSGLRIVRGGSWNSTPDQLRSAYGARISATSTVDDVGFRIVRTTSE